MIDELGYKRGGYVLRGMRDARDIAAEGGGVILGTRSGVLHDNYASLQICTVCEREEREKMSRR